jgi:hypothetical protein
VGSSCDTDGNVVCWACGSCAGYYANKVTTHLQCTRTVISDAYLLMFPLEDRIVLPLQTVGRNDINKNVAAA